MNIAVIHPDLGIGGAERLVVDAAVGLQNIHKHNVTMYTAHHSTDHCFIETKGGTLKVQVHGDFLPTKVLGGFHVLCSIIRMHFLTLMIWFSMKKYDIFLVDQVSAHIPLLRFLNPSAKIVFYCHFPDKLLSKPAVGALAPLKKIYRAVFDAIEEFTTGMAHSILVNSEFTGTQFAQQFKSLLIKPKVLYPPINTALYDEKPPQDSKQDRVSSVLSKKIGIVSINRFERKKGIDLAVKSFDIVKKKTNRNDLVLVLAGGYDPNLEENVLHFAELQDLVKKLNLSEHVLMVPSFSNVERYALLHDSAVIVYTPQNEHFGIVPVEAMYCERCVVAANSGGPLESIKDKETGFLVENEPNAFADAIIEFLNMTEKQRETFGKNARKRVQSRYTLEVFADGLNSEFQRVSKLASNSFKRYFVSIVVVAPILFVVLSWLLIQ
ncbi:alpha-1,3/alpha-1,6-mannosyltransferase [Acrasis kona]|uniref:Alpha-1,3/1,6-mannosyltransferase ALG2 n=1 Tax=Acrasis kona TaxID=1008807 RepID=A0AAW2ZD88_9EUKA